MRCANQTIKGFDTDHPQRDDETREKTNTGKAKMKTLQPHYHRVFTHHELSPQPQSSYDRDRHALDVMSRLLDNYDDPFQVMTIYEQTQCELSSPHAWT